MLRSRHSKTIEQLRENLASTRVQLSEADLRALDEVSQLPPEYPGWMLAFQSQYRSKPPVKE